MKVAIVLALVGLALANPTSWEYNYEADMAAHDGWNPDVVSGTKLVGKIHASLANDKKSVNIQMSNLATCMKVETNQHPAGRTPPLRCTPGQIAPQWRTQLEKPFAIYFTSTGERLMIPSDDCQWIANLRKGVSSMWRIPFVFSQPSAPEVLGSASQTPYSFDRTEDTIHGKCLARYTVSKKMEGGSQHGDQQEYKLLRSVDVSACSSEQVVITKASHGNFSEAGYDQFRRVAARASFGTYTLLGVPTTRLSSYVKRAALEGTVVVHDLNTAKRSSVAVTNQTVSLISTAGQRVVPSASDLVAEPWTFRAGSDHKRASDSPQWIKFLNKGTRNPMYPEKWSLGLEPGTPDQIKAVVVKHITNVMVLLRQPYDMTNEQDYTIKNTTNIYATVEMRKIVDLMRMLPSTQQQQLFTQFEQDTLGRALVWKAMKSSGSAASFQVLIDLVKTNKLSGMEIIGLFSTLNIGAYDPVMVADLIDWSTQHLPSDPEIQAAVLINLSTLVRRICVTRPTNSFIFPRALFGANQCTDRVAPYVNFLLTKLNEDEQQNKQHLVAIYMQALANVGNQQCMQALAKYAKGEVSIPSIKTFQLHAINGMTKNHLRNSSDEYVRGVLLSIVEAEKYETEIRQAAVVSLFTLPQNASMWHRVAMSTWYESDLRVARFIYSYIKSVSESKNPNYRHQLNAAQTAVVLARPFNFTAMDSQYYAYSNFFVASDFGIEFELVNALKQSSQTPELIKSKIISFFSGLKYPVFHASSVGKQIPSEFVRSAKTLLNGLLAQQQTRAGQYREALSYLENSKDIQQIMHTTLLKDIEFFVPVSGDFIEEILRPRQSILAKAIDSFKNAHAYEAVIYTKLSENQVIVPTDIGLPVVVNIDDNLMMYFTVGGHFMSKAAKVWRTEVQILAPWEKRKISAGFLSEASFTIPPTIFTAKKDVSRPEATMLSYEFGKSPQSQKQSVVVANWIPFVALEEFMPNQPSQGVFQPIAKRPVRAERFNLIPAELVNITAKFVGNDLCGQNFQSLWTMDSKDLYSKEAWQIVLSHTPSQQSKTIAGNVIYASKPGNAAAQQANGAQPMVPNMRLDDSLEQRVENMMRSPARKMLSVSMEARNAGSAKKIEMVNLMSQQQQNAPMQKWNHQIVIMHNGSPQQKHLCVSSELKMPKISRGAAGSQLASEALPAELTSQIYNGQCQQSAHAMTLKAKAEMSPERKQHVRNLAAKPIYDLLNVQVEKIKPVSPLVEKVIDFGHHYLYPSFEAPSRQNSPSQIASIMATRSLRNDRMNLRLQSSRYVSSRGGIKIPQFMDRIIPAICLNRGL